MVIRRSSELEPTPGQLWKRLAANSTGFYDLSVTNLELVHFFNARSSINAHPFKLMPAN